MQNECLPVAAGSEVIRELAIKTVARTLAMGSPKRSTIHNGAVGRLLTSDLGQNQSTPGDYYAGGAVACSDVDAMRKEQNDLFISRRKNRPRKRC